MTPRDQFLSVFVFCIGLYAQVFFFLRIVCRAIGIHSDEIFDVARKPGVLVCAASQVW